MAAITQWIFITLSLIATVYSHPDIKWINPELDSLKYDVKSAQSLLATLYARMERMQVDVTQMMREAAARPALPPPPPPPPAPAVPRKTDFYPKTCAEYALMGDTREGLKTIQPYRDMKPFIVRCIYNGQMVSTEIGLTSPSVIAFQGPRTCRNEPELRVPGSTDICPGTEAAVPYQLTEYEINAAMSVSGKCSQELLWRCHAHSLLYVKGPSGNLTLYGKPLEELADISQGVCECAKKKQCLGCNCGEDKPEAWLDDNIIVDGAVNLPVRKVMFGDLATSREKAIVDVGPVKCVTTIS